MPFYYYKKENEYKPLTTTVLVEAIEEYKSDLGQDRGVYKIYIDRLLFDFKSEKKESKDDVLEGSQLYESIQKRIKNQKKHVSEYPGRIFLFEDILGGLKTSQNNELRLRAQYFEGQIKADQGKIYEEILERLDSHLGIIKFDFQEMVDEFKGVNDFYHDLISERETRLAVALKDFSTCLDAFSAGTQLKIRQSFPPLEKSVKNLYKVVFAFVPTSQAGIFFATKIKLGFLKCLAAAMQKYFQLRVDPLSNGDGFIAVDVNKRNAIKDILGILKTDKNLFADSLVALINQFRLSLVQQKISREIVKLIFEKFKGIKILSTPDSSPAKFKKSYREASFTLGAKEPVDFQEDNIMVFKKFTALLNDYKFASMEEQKTLQDIASMAAVFVDLKIERAPQPSPSKSV